MDQNVPWESFKEVVKDLGTTSTDYSRVSADLVGNIQTELMNAIDTYNSATQSMYEWCGTTKQLLSTYVNLFHDGNASKQMVQTGSLINILENQKQKIETAQTELATCTEHLNSIAQFSALLENRLNHDFDDSSEYFRSKLARILRKSHDPAVEKCHWIPWCGNGSTDIDSTEEKLTRELKEKLSSIRQFHENLKAQAYQAFVDVRAIEEKSNDKIEAIDEQKTRVGQIEAYDVLDLIAELRSSAIESANNLIANCDEYRNKHTN